MKVKIQNFQNIDEEELEVDGFTTVVGKSNIGKSSIVRAIEGAFLNKGGDDFVRDGKRYTNVEIEADDIDLVWRKGSNKNSYIIDGEEYNKVGRGAPDIIREKGYGKIQTERADVNPQVAKQFSPIFLINPSKTSGSVVAEIISDIGRLSDVQNALRDSSSDRREAEQTLKVRKEDLKDSRESLKFFEGLDDTLADVEEIESLREEIDDLKGEIEMLEKMKSKRNSLKSKVDELESVEGISIPEAGFKEDISQIKNALALKTSYSDAVENLESFQGVSDISIPDLDIDDAFEDVEKLFNIKSEYENLISSAKSLKTSITEIGSKEEKLNSKLNELFNEAGKCPTCERDVHD